MKLYKKPLKTIGNAIKHQNNKNPEGAVSSATMELSPRTIPCMAFEPEFHDGTPTGPFGKKTHCLDSQVAGNNGPLYSKVDHYWFKVVYYYKPLALQVVLQDDELLSDGAALFVLQVEDPWPPLQGGPT